MKKQKRLSSNKKKWVWPGLVLLAVVITMLILELSNTTHLFHAGKPVVLTTAGQSTKGEPADNSKTQPTTPTSTSTNQPGDSKSDTGGAAVTNLLAPSGNFVSAHKDIPQNATLASVCNTSPGATCTISFSLNGATKSLPTQTTDRGGSTYWNDWSPGSIGLTAGSWKITATAQLNGKTSSAVDALELVVSP